jgi:hypothetical protein
MVDEFINIFFRLHDHQVNVHEFFSMLLNVFITGKPNEMLGQIFRPLHQYGTSLPEICSAFQYLFADSQSLQIKGWSNKLRFHFYFLYFYLDFSLL